MNLYYTRKMFTKTVSIIHLKKEYKFFLINNSHIFEIVDILLEELHFRIIKSNGKSY